MGLLDTLQITASGLTAQRLRLQTVASNMANARTTRTEEGGHIRNRCLCSRRFAMSPLDQNGSCDGSRRGDGGRGERRSRR